MKKMLTNILLLLSLNSYAMLSIEVVDPCANTASVYEEVNILAPASVKEIVNLFFPSFNIPYEATETSIIHIFNTPTTEESVEIVAPNHVRYYGWCYEVDGLMPDVTMDRFIVDPAQTSKIRWFYGYAEMIDNSWVHYCEPLYKHPQQFICADQFN